MLGLGWEPGQTLGRHNNGIRKPIVAKGQDCKTGLGSNLKENNSTNSELLIVENLKHKSDLDSRLLVQTEVVSSLFDEEDNITADKLEIVKSEIEVEFI